MLQPPKNLKTIPNTTQVTFEGKVFTTFMEARQDFRVSRTNRMYDQQAVKEVSAILGIPEAEADAILAGKIPVKIDEKGKSAIYDRAHAKNLLAPEPIDMVEVEDGEEEAEGEEAGEGEGKDIPAEEGDENEPRYR
jgi:hypothetical protein